MANSIEKILNNFKVYNEYFSPLYCLNNNESDIRILVDYIKSNETPTYIKSGYSSMHDPIAINNDEYFELIDKVIDRYHGYVSIYIEKIIKKYNKIHSNLNGREIYAMMFVFLLSLNRDYFRIYREKYDSNTLKEYLNSNNIMKLLSEVSEATCELFKVKQEQLLPDFYPVDDKTYYRYYFDVEKINCSLMTQSSLFVKPFKEIFYRMYNYLFDFKNFFDEDTVYNVFDLFFNSNYKHTNINRQGITIDYLYLIKEDNIGIKKEFKNGSIFLDSIFKELCKLNPIDLKIEIYDKTYPLQQENDNIPIDTVKAIFDKVINEINIDMRRTFHILLNDFVFKLSSFIFYEPLNSFKYFVEEETLDLCFSCDNLFDIIINLKEYQKRIFELIKNGKFKKLDIYINRVIARELYDPTHLTAYLYNHGVSTEMGQWIIKMLKKDVHKNPDGAINDYRLSKKIVSELIVEV